MQTFGSSSKGKGNKSKSADKPQVVFVDADMPQCPPDIVDLTGEGLPPAAAPLAVSSPPRGTISGYSVNPFATTAPVIPQGPCQAELPLLGTSAPRGLTLQDTTTATTSLYL